MGVVLFRRINQTLNFYFIFILPASVASSAFLNDWPHTECILLAHPASMAMPPAGLCFTDDFLTEINGNNSLTKSTS